MIKPTKKLQKKKIKKKILNRTYTVYKIDIDGITRYIGMTFDIASRQKQHRNDFKKGKLKILYNTLRDLKFSGEFVLTPIRVFSNRLDCRHYETLMILIDKFGNGELYQRVPRISDV